MPRTFERQLEASNLVLIPTQPVWGEKCAHGSTPPPGQRQTGRWAVKLEDKFYVFEPGTQMQKDIWLGNSYDNPEKDRELNEFQRALKMGALRWYCAQCGTVQEP